MISPKPNVDDEQKSENDLEFSEDVLMENSYNTNDDYNDNNSMKSKCKECGFEFESEKMKKNHILTNHRDIMMICADCDDVFLSESELVTHSEMVHHSTRNTDNNKKNQYKCNYCKKNNKENSACLLCKLYQKNKSCDYIKILASNNEKFKNGMSEQQNTDDNINNAGEIENSDIDKDSDSMMIKKTIDALAEDKNSSSENSFNNLLKKVIQPKPNMKSMTMTRMQKHYGLKCKLCEEAFEDKKLLRNHLVTNHRNTCPLCRESFERNVDLQEHMKKMHETFEGRKSNTEKVQHLCHLCTKIFNKPSTLKVHLDSVHYQIRDHTCDFCGKGFINRNKLKYHVERAHEKIRNYLCDMCDKQFYFNTDLTKHKKSTHAESKDFVCRHCGKAFATLGRQKHHEEVVHEGIKKYNCKLCEKRFSTSTLLKRHMKKSHHHHQEIQHISVGKKITA